MPSILLTLSYSGAASMALTNASFDTGATDTASDFAAADELFLFEEALDETALQEARGGMVGPNGHMHDVGFSLVDQRGPDLSALGSGPQQGPDLSQLADVKDGPDLSQLDDIKDGPDLSQLGDIKDGPDLSQLDDIKDGPDLSQLDDIKDGPDLSQLDDIKDGPDLSQLDDINNGPDLSQLDSVKEGPDLSALNDVGGNRGATAQEASPSQETTKVLQMGSGLRFEIVVTDSEPVVTERDNTQAGGTNSDGQTTGETNILRRVRGTSVVNIVNNTRDNVIVSLETNIGVRVPNYTAQTSILRMNNSALQLGFSSSLLGALR